MIWICSERAVHDVQANPAGHWMLEGTWNGSDDGEAEPLIDLDCRRIGLRYGVELHARVASCSRPVQRVPAQCRADSLAPRVTADHETRRCDMRTGARLIGAQLRSADDVAVLDVDHGVTGRRLDPGLARLVGGHRRVVSVGVPGPDYLAHDRPYSRPVVVGELSYLHRMHGSACQRRRSGVQVLL